MCNTGNKLLKKITRENLEYQMVLLSNTKFGGGISWKAAAHMRWKNSDHS
jgi:hypothetical protein